MTDASSSLVTKVDQLDTDTHAFLTEVGANTAGIDKALKDNESNLTAIDNSYAHIVGNTVQAQLAAERTEAFAEAKSLRQAMHLAVAPRPDLWLPLVSNLKLREGFGEVSFSRPTTATYVNKSGQLVTAKANEPRFEREGILIEGGSTNLCYGKAGPNDLDMTENGLFYRLTPKSRTDSKQSYLRFRFDIPSNIKFDGSITISYFINPMGKTKTQWEVSLAKTNTKTGEEKNTWISKVVGLDNPTAQERGEVIKYSDSLYKVIGKLTANLDDPEWKDWVTTGGSASVYPFVLNDKGERYYACNGSQYTEEVSRVQVEKLPFATSFIPTNGQPVSRAAEVLTISSSGNFPHKAGDVSIACQYDCMGRIVNGTAYIFTYGPNAIETESFRAISDPGLSLARYGARISTGGRLSLSTHFAATVKNNLSAMSIEKKHIGSRSSAGNPKDNDVITIGGRENSYQLNGHIRNFRIWHRALTPEQIAFL